MPTCSVSDCERDVWSRGYCGMHYQRWRKHGDPTTVGVSRTTIKPGQVLNPAGPGRLDKHPGWAGPECSYGSAHDRVKRERGSATKHLCVDCGRTASEWSYTKGDPDERVEVRAFPRGKSRAVAYSPWPSFYVARCRACHWKADHQ